MMFLFLAILLACPQYVSTANLVPVTNQFDANKQFLDLSVNNFENKPDSVYTYSLKARPGAKVSIYFLTVTTDNCGVELFNGVDSNAEKVDTSTLTNVPNLIGQILPIKFTSTTENYFLRVTALPNAGADFQAIATDFENNADCSSTFIYAVGTIFRYPTASFSKPATSCIHILRVVDTTNNRGMFMTIQNYTKGNFEGNMYKGMMMTPENKIKSLDNFYITDRNVIVETTNAAEFTITYNFQDMSDGAVLKTGLQSGLKQTVMTQDYIPYRTINGITKQTFSILGQTDVNRMQLTFLNTIGTADIQINSINKGAETVIQKYTQATFPTAPITLNAQELQIQYTGDAATAKGLYALVADATTRSDQPTNSPGENNNGTGNNNNGDNGGKKDKAASNLFSLLFSVLCENGITLLFDDMRHMKVPVTDVTLDTLSKKYLPRQISLKGLVTEITFEIIKKMIEAALTSGITDINWDFGYLKKDQYQDVHGFVYEKFHEWTRRMKMPLYFKHGYDLNYTITRRGFNYTILHREKKFYEFFINFAVEKAEVPLIQII